MMTIGSEDAAFLVGTGGSTKNKVARVSGRGLHSSMPELNLSNAKSRS